jgi:1,6-anhydro-N-acetylmuramate kinase
MGSLAKAILAEDNIRSLAQAADWLGTVEDDTYADASERCFHFGIGNHVRHLLEHYELFLDQWPSGRVDYDRRPRNPRYDRDRLFAVGRIAEIAEDLRGIPFSAAERRVTVRIDGGGNPDTDWCHSTVKRELQFLQTHDVHHFALIAFIVRLGGGDAPEDFGVDPSRLRHLKRPVRAR